MSRAAMVLVVSLIIAASSFHAAAQLTTSSVNMRVYDDGTVVATQVVTVPADFTSVDLELVSSLIANPVATDQSGSSLYFQITGQNITIYTIGATQVTLTYDTASLTSKQGTVWTLAFQAYYNTTVVLPQGSTLTSASGTPTSIGTANGSPVVAVSPGHWQIAYGVPIKVTTSSTSSTTSSSTTSTTSSSTISPTTSTTSTTSSSSSSSNAVSTGSTTTSAASSSSLVGTSGSTTSTLGSSAVTSTAGGRSSTGTANSLESLAAAILVIAVFGVFLFIRRRRAHDIGGQNSELRPDDIKVIEFISERGGKVLEPEVRMRFALPKTSAWRQIKRLERLGYVKVTKIGSQNQIELLKSRPSSQSG